MLAAQQLAMCLIDKEGDAARLSSCSIIADQAEFARRAQDAGVRYFVVRSIDNVQNLEL
jgi:hypothetical protein